jgi:hypothetical protein
MTDATRHPVLYKLRYTPVFDFFRIGFTARLDLNRPLETAALPVSIKQVIKRVVRRTRVWRLEKLDVLTELIGHFTDGIAAGISADGLIAAFGNEASAAKLIRRAKRRNRPFYWQALRFASQSLAVVLAIYGGLALYFFSGRPSPRIDYVAIQNRTSLNTPEAGSRVADLSPRAAGVQPGSRAKGSVLRHPRGARLGATADASRINPAAPGED